MIIMPIVQDSQHRFSFENREYEWSGRTWFDSRTKGIPPLRVVAKLNALQRQGEHGK